MIAHSRKPTSSPARQGFTLIELLVVVVIIALLASIVLGALSAAQELARQQRTKATIAKLDSVIMRKYDAYFTRRVPISTQGMTTQQAAQLRLDAIRDLMRMELPDWPTDVTNPPATGIATPALAVRYAQSPLPGAGSPFAPAEMLYLIVSIGSAKDIQLFNQSEIGDTDEDGCPEFIDGWGRPIMFLRWAPGFIPANGAHGIQTGDAVNDHDPFDVLKLEPAAFHLTPLIYSGGPDREYGLSTGQGGGGTGVGAPNPPGSGEHYDNIHNHLVEAR